MQNDAKWLKMTQNDAKWHKMTQTNSNWQVDAKGLFAIQQDSERNWNKAEAYSINIVSLVNDDRKWKL